MICPKCNSYNNDNAKFCRKCGASLLHDETSEFTPPAKTYVEESFFKKNKLLLICIAAVAVIAIGAGVYAFTMGHDVPLQTQNFGQFSMSVPKGSNFVVDSSADMGLVGGFATYKNLGDYSDEAYYFDVSSLSSSLTPSGFTLDSTDGDLKIYKDTGDSGLYVVQRNVNNYMFRIMGKDLDTLKEMARSIQVTGTISNDTAPATASAPTSSSSVSTTTASSSSPLKILGGSFSTGDALEDKTYAEIYVGSQHAGEKVIVQIFYSRDGASLNNGNYVPVTVDSSGYISVSSADAYSMFPDYATIKLYDANQKLQDTLSVSLYPQSGTQTF